MLIFLKIMCGFSSILVLMALLLTSLMPDPYRYKKLSPKNLYTFPILGEEYDVFIITGVGIVATTLFLSTLSGLWFLDDRIGITLGVATILLGLTRTDVVFRLVFKLPKPLWDFIRVTISIGVIAYLVILTFS